MNNIIYDDEYILLNNNRLLSPYKYKIQPRYMPEINEFIESQGNPSVKDKNTVNDKHKIFLMHVYKYQYNKMLTEICRLSGFPGGTGSKIAKTCVKKKLIKNIKVPFLRGVPKFSVLTPRGYEILGLQEKKFNGRGAGDFHTICQFLISNHFSDYNPIIECYLNNKFVDVAIEVGGKLVCIEIELNETEHIKENIEKDIISAAEDYKDYVVIVCCEKKLLSKVQEIVSDLQENMKNNTRIYLISDLLKMNPDEILAL